jgi:hypothetical protein
MESHMPRRFSIREVEAYRIGNHRLQFGESIALCGDAAIAWFIVPTSDEAAVFGRLDGKGDFSHASNLPHSHANDKGRIFFEMRWSK